MRKQAWLWMVLALAPAAAGAGEPFLLQNENPLSRLYGLPAGDDAALPAPTGYQACAVFDLANYSYEKHRGGDELVLDGETWVARFLLRRSWSNGWRVALPSLPCCCCSVSWLRWWRGHGPPFPTTA